MVSPKMASIASRPEWQVLLLLLAGASLVEPLDTSKWWSDGEKEPGYKNIVHNLSPQYCSVLGRTNQEIPPGLRIGNLWD